MPDILSNKIPINPVIHTPKNPSPKGVRVQLETHHPSISLGVTASFNFVKGEYCSSIPLRIKSPKRKKFGANNSNKNNEAVIFSINSMSNFRDNSKFSYISKSK